MPITFACPHCAHLLEISDTLAGQTAQCSNCRRLVVVPLQQLGNPHGSQESLDRRLGGVIALLFVCFLFSPLALFITEDRRYCRDCGMGLN